ncbi:MAG: hypothetical protein ABSG74_04695 [Candidatus Bathyarchaeia archaeon]
MKRAEVALLSVLALAVFTCTVVPSHASMSVISGTIYWSDQYGNVHPFSWVQVTATSADGNVTVTSSTVDGTYVLYVAPGTYEVTASPNQAFISQSKTVTVSPGGMAGGVDFQLEPSGKPIPEYPSVTQPILLLMATLAAAVFLRQRGRARSEADHD